MKKYIAEMLGTMGYRGSRQKTLAADRKKCKTLKTDNVWAFGVHY